MEVFPFTLFDSFDPDEVFDVTSVPGNANEITRNNSGDYGRYTAAFDLVLPFNSQTIDTWVTFLRSVHGATDTFLFKDPIVSTYRASSDSGTANGSATDFALVQKYVDASTLVVRDNGSIVSSGYSLVGNNSAPLVRFSVAPTNGHTILCTYEFYRPVKFLAPPPRPVWRPGNVYRISGVQVVEDYAGASRV